MRGFTRAALVARAREVRKATGRIGLVSAAVCDRPEVAPCIKRLMDERPKM